MNKKVDMSLCYRLGIEKAHMCKLCIHKSHSKGLPIYCREHCCYVKADMGCDKFIIDL